MTMVVDRCGNPIITPRLFQGMDGLWHAVIETADGRALYLSSGSTDPLRGVGELAVMINGGEKPIDPEQNFTTTPERHEELIAEGMAP